MNRTLQNQEGAVLISGLMVLLILTLIGITAMQNSTLEEVMSRNMDSRNIAFQAAEAALRAGESVLVGTLPTFDGTATAASPNGLYSTRIDIGSLAWDSTDSAQYSWTASSKTASDPRYVIELLSTIEVDNGEDDPVTETNEGLEERTAFRVTARGVGSSANTVVILQSTYLY